MEDAILILIKTMEERLKYYEQEYSKAVDRELEDSNFITSSNLGFYAGMKISTEIELEHLNYVLRVLVTPKK